MPTLHTTARCSHREQLAFLQARQCGEGPGSCFSPPLAAEAFASLLPHGHSAAVVIESVQVRGPEVAEQLCSCPR